MRTSSLVRYAICLGAAKGDILEAHEIALRRYGAGDSVTHLTKAAVSPGTTTDGVFGSSLVGLRNAGSEFAEAMRPRSLLMRVRAAMRRVPFNTRVSSITSGSGSAWVGEGMPIPVSNPTFSEIVTLPVMKLGVIVVETNELVQFATQLGNEDVVQQDMVTTVAEEQDLAFLSDVAASADNPAGILAGVTPISSAGNMISDVISDLEQLFAELTDLGILLNAPFLITSPKVCVQLALKHGADGAPAFPGVGVNGGELAGCPLLSSASVPSDSTGDSIVLIDASEILLADDDITEIGVSAHAAIRMDSEPGGSAGESVASMWQQNCAAIRAIRFVNWLKRRPQVAAYISGVNYSSITS